MNNKTPNKDCPAFAAINHDYIQEGLTKREYFAGLAMQGLLATHPPHKDNRYYGVGTEETKKNITEFAKYSIQIGDELLKQLDL